MTRFQLALRAGVLLLIALALAWDRLPGDRLRETRYAMVLDDSASMRARHPRAAEEALAAWQRLDGGRHPVILAREHPMPAGSAPRAAETLTDVGGALREAAALFPATDPKRIVLATDAFWNPETLAGVGERLRKAGAAVYSWRPREGARVTGALDVTAPPRIFLWEPFTVRGRIGATAPGNVDVVLRRNGVPVLERVVEVGWSGIADLEYLAEAEQVGPLEFSVEIKGLPESAASCETEVASSPKVLYVTDDLHASARLLGLLRAAGIDVRTVAASELGADGEELAAGDVVVLDDVPAGALPEGFVERLQRLVAEEGRGLLAIGGRKSLGSEEYRDTRLESLLPATVGYSSPAAPPQASIVLVLDTSFSMAFRGRGERLIHSGKPRKIDVALESTRQVVRVFRPGDKLGILGNSTDLFWIHPLGEITDREGVLRAIDGVTPQGDGLNFYSAVREAYRVLREDPAPVRHVMVFCDAEDIDQYEVLGEGHAHDLIRRMAEDGVTVSVLSIGQLGDKDVPFLRTATTLGKGDFYLISALAALPRYFVSEYRKLSSRLFLEEEIEAVAGDYSPLLAGIEEDLPALRGIDTLTARKASSAPVGTVAGIPLVVLGRYGRGKTAVFASDNGLRWAPEWISWGSSRKFWLKLLFSVAPGEERGRKFSQPQDAEAGEGRVALQYRGKDEAFPPWDELRLRLEPPPASLPGGVLRLERVGLRTYRDAGARLAPGLHRAAVAAGEPGSEIERLAVTVPSSPELLALPADWGPLETLVKETGGASVASVEEVADAGRSFRVDTGRARLALIAIGVLLLCGEALINDRRWR